MMMQQQAMQMAQQAAAENPEAAGQAVGEMAQQQGDDYKTLVYYFERHIEVDSGEHGPMAQQMMQELCGDNTSLWDEANEAAQQALQKRIALWDFIEKSI